MSGDASVLGGVKLADDINGTLDLSSSSSSKGGLSFIGDQVNGGGKIGLVKMLALGAVMYFIVKAWRAK